MIFPAYRPSSYRRRHRQQQQRYHYRKAQERERERLATERKQSQERIYSTIRQEKSDLELQMYMSTTSQSDTLCERLGFTEDPWIAHARNIVSIMYEK